MALPHYGGKGTYQIRLITPPHPQWASTRSQNVAVRAGRLMLEELSNHFVARTSFAFETTLSGRGYLRLIEKWQAAGYRVKIIFLQLGSADEALARVAQRVKQGGHNIPEAVIRRRFAAGKENFEKLYAPRA